MEKAAFTIREASERYGLPAYTLRRWVRECKLRVIRSGNRSYLPKAELERLKNLTTEDNK